jgi:hypothetical protein
MIAGKMKLNSMVIFLAMVSYCMGWCLQHTFNITGKAVSVDYSPNQLYIAVAGLTNFGTTIFDAVTLDILSTILPSNPLTNQVSNSVKFNSFSTQVAIGYPTGFQVVNISNGVVIVANKTPTVASLDFSTKS